MSDPNLPPGVPVPPNPTGMDQGTPLPNYQQQYPPQQGYQQPYPPQGYQQPYYGGQRQNSLALISLIAGIAGLTIFFGIGSIVAVITGHMANKQIAERGESGKGMATTGLVLGYIGIILSVLAIIAVVAFWGFFMTNYGWIYNYG